MLRWTSITCLNLVLLWIAVLAGNPAKAANCRALVIAEYCLESGAMTTLMPVDGLEVYFSKRADILDAIERRPSKIIQAKQERIRAMWLQAVAEAFEYAENHAIRLEHVQDTTPLNISGDGALNRIMQVASQGPILRLTFREGRDGVYRLSKPVEFQRDRLLAAVTDNASLLGGDASFAVLPLAVILGMSNSGEYLGLNSNVGRQGALVIRQFWPELYDAIAYRALSVLGWEVMVGFLMDFEERIFERNRQLAHRVVFFRPDRKTLWVGSPQVSFNGTLFLPDDAVDLLTEEELMMLLRHEAMHLARPNFFTVASAAESVLQRWFPELSIERSTPILANFFGRDVADQTLNCPLLIEYDDELFTDYYVMAMIKDDPEKIDIYQKMLEKLRDTFDRGDLSRMSFRVDQVPLVKERFATTVPGGFDISRQNELMTEALQASLPVMATQYFSGKTPNVDDILTLMEDHPELRSDAQMIRHIITYYKIYGDLKMTPDHTHPGATVLDCETMGRMLSTVEF